LAKRIPSKSPFKLTTHKILAVTKAGMLLEAIYATDECVALACHLSDDLHFTKEVFPNTPVAGMTHEACLAIIAASICKIYAAFDTGIPVMTVEQAAKIIGRSEREFKLWEKAGLARIIPYSPLMIDFSVLRSLPLLKAGDAKIALHKTIRKKMRKLRTELQLKQPVPEFYISNGKAKTKGRERPT